MESAKCPNCLQPVAPDSRFCIYCGCDLTETAVPAETAAAETPETGMPEAADIPRFCPRGHDITDPSLGFCPVCGSTLTDKPGTPEEKKPEADTPAPEEPAPAPEIPKAPPAPPAIRKCSCGYICDDPALNFCPACGLPLEAARPVPPPAPPERKSPAPDKAGWTCSCGQWNPIGMNFCTFCGQPRKVAAREYTRPIAPKDSTTVVPEGMYEPDEDDLKPKSRYGN